MLNIATVGHPLSAACFLLHIQQDVLKCFVYVKDLHFCSIVKCTSVCAFYVSWNNIIFVRVVVNLNIKMLQYSSTLSGLCYERYELFSIFVMRFVYINIPIAQNHSTYSSLYITSKIQLCKSTLAFCLPRNFFLRA